MLIWILVAIATAIIAGFFIKKKNNELAKQHELDIKVADKFLKDLEFSNQLTFNNYIEVFKGRLLTLEDDKSITFQQAGMIELKIFYENISQLMEKIRAEESEKLDAHNYSPNLKDFLNKYLLTFISKSGNTLQIHGMTLFEEKLLEIANSKSENS